MDAYKQEVKDAITYAEYLKFDKTRPWHRNLIALYCSLIEYSDCLIYLVENEKNISVPVIFRGLLEAFVDFKNLSQDKKYGYYMEAAYTKEWLKVFEGARQNENPYLASISKDESLQTQIKENQEELEKLKKNGFESLSQRDKFDRAGMIKEYRSIYNFVCSHSHNNIRSLIDRFFIINEAEQDFTIALFKEQEDGKFNHYLETGRQFLRNGSHNIHAVLETGYENNFPV